MMRVLRHLRNNLGTALLSLLLAFVIWIWATLEANPFAANVVPNVPVTLLNQPDDTVLYNADKVSDRVAVEVRGPGSVVEEANSSDLLSVMDLSVLQPGTPEPVTVQVTSTNEALRVLGVDPVKQVVLLESLTTLTVSVTIEVQGQVAAGYRSLSPLVIPNEVAVHGAAPDVALVVAAVGSVSVEGARADVVDQVPVVPVDAGGDPVQDVELIPDEVEVQVGVRRLVDSKPDVEVVPDLRGDPAPGYRLGSLRVEPQQVTLFGVPSVLEGVPGFVETLPISVTGATEDISERTTLSVPNGIVVYGGNYVVVNVEVLPIESSRAMTATVEIQGVRPTWIAAPSPDVVDVILEGPDAILSALEPGDVRVALGLFGYDLGVHRVEITEDDVLVPVGVRVVSVIPETLEVVIAPIPTPTPAPTITPTLTITPTATIEP